MFKGCSSLNYIKCMAINKKSNSLNGWVEGVSATGTLVINEKATPDFWTVGTSGIPNNWEVQTASA